MVAAYCKMDVLMSPTTVGARPTNSLTDLVLGGELLLFFTAWCCEWPNALMNKKLDFFITFALNLLGGAVWCLSGVYIHSQEPLPAQPTGPWRAFLLLGSVSPLLFPIVVTRAFGIGQEHVKKMQYLVATIAALVYGVAVFSSMDLSGGSQVAPISISPWHGIDGRSYGGQEYGISFDLLSTMPCWRGDSNFVLSLVFVTGKLLGFVLLVSVGWADQSAYAKDISGAAKRLAISTGVMVLNCLLLLNLIVAFNFAVSTAVDAFHVMQALIFGAAFIDFRIVLRHQDKKMS